MEKEFVPYELALRMKQLGFDEPCVSWYTKYGEFTKDYSYPKKLNSMNELGTYISAPTFSQAFRWFREKYNVHIRIEKYDETKWWANWGSWTSEVYDSYEEAELACLEKLIEIVESNGKEEML